MDVSVVAVTTGVATPATFVDTARLLTVAVAVDAAGSSVPLVLTSSTPVVIPAWSTLATLSVSFPPVRGNVTRGVGGMVTTPVASMPNASPLTSVAVCANARIGSTASESMASIIASTRMPRVALFAIEANILLVDFEFDPLVPGYSGQSASPKMFECAPACRERGWCGTPLRGTDTVRGSPAPCVLPATCFHLLLVCVL